jgi:hypothetical protein
MTAFLMGLKNRVSVARFEKLFNFIHLDKLKMRENWKVSRFYITGWMRQDE